MDILDKIGRIERDVKQINEMGMRDITKLAKQYKTATGYFHMDTDGVTSAIAMKKYLESYGIKTIKFIPINYGSTEFAAFKPAKDTLVWMVDFAHGKPFLNIHTDHHDAQAGVAAGSSHDFSHTPANAGRISAIISPSDLFPPRDIKVINMVDSADFANNNINPDQVMNAAFGLDKTIDVEKNHQAMGLVVNKLLLANKNKDQFLVRLVAEANPSLISMYNTIVNLSKEFGYKAPAEIGPAMKDYVEGQRKNMKPEGYDIKLLKNGESTMYGTTIVQYGGGYMMKAYDRYTPFKLYPDAEYFIIGWSMGLIQVSKNPFKKGTNPIDLGDLILGKVLNRWKAKLDAIDVNLDDLKRIFEMDIEKQVEKHHSKYSDSLGFTWEDVCSMFQNTPEVLKGVDLSKEGGWTNFLKSIAKNKYRFLTPRQKELLQKVKVSLYDVIKVQSGGHHDITNLQGLAFAGKGYVDRFMKPMMQDIADEMKDRKLQ